MTPEQREWKRAHDARKSLERYRQALVRIADAESGHWGRIAHEALHPERAKEKS